MSRFNREVHLTSTLMSRTPTKRPSSTENANDKETTFLQLIQLANMLSVSKTICRPSLINWWTLISWWKVNRDASCLSKLDKLLIIQAHWKRVCSGCMECWWTLKGCRNSTLYSLPWPVERSTDSFLQSSHARESWFLDSEVHTNVCSDHLLSPTFT